MRAALCPTAALVASLPRPPCRSIKRYFLMDQGDFFVHFMDLTEEELRKPVDDITPTRLEALLELALRMSTANTDPFKDDLKVGRGPGGGGAPFRPAYPRPDGWRKTQESPALDGDSASPS